jgi:hypothetical protein
MAVWERIQFEPAGGFLAGDGRHGSTKPIPANRRSRRRSNNECRCRSDYFARASRNFFALQSFFSRISQEVV